MLYQKILSLELKRQTLSLLFSKTRLGDWGPKHNLLVSAAVESMREEECFRGDPFAESEVTSRKLGIDCAVTVEEASGEKLSLTLQRDCCELEVGH
jgi:hypothetical protein